MDDVWTEEDERPGGRFNHHFGSAVDRSRVGIEPAQLGSVIGAGQASVAVAADQDREGTVCRISVVKGHHHVREMIDVIVIVNPVRRVLMPAETAPYTRPLQIEFRGPERKGFCRQ